jgi:hypothetical protein
MGERVGHDGHWCGFNRAYAIRPYIRIASSNRIVYGQAAFTRLKRTAHRNEPH